MIKFWWQSASRTISRHWQDVPWWRYALSHSF